MLGVTRFREHHGHANATSSAVSVRRPGRRGSGSPETNAPFEDHVGRRAAGFHRRLVVVAALAVVAVVAVSAALALRQYRSAQHSALNDLRSRAVVAAAVVNTAFAGDVATLGAVAGAPALVTEDHARMRAYLDRLARSRGSAFNGGLGWIDRRGVARVSTTAPPTARPLSVADRTYFKRVLATGQPYVSAGLITHRQHQAVVVVAVPTRDAGGRITGVLAGSIRLRTVSNSKSELELGYEGLDIVDRNGHLLLSGLVGVRNAGLLARVRASSTGVIAGTRGLAGRGNDVVAFATAAVPAWIIVIDRPRSAVDAAALRSLVLQLASLGAAILVVFGMIVFVVRRSRRDREIQDTQARAWSGLTRSLAGAATPDEVAVALADSLAAAFPDSIALVAFETVEGSREVRTPQTRIWRRIAESPGAIDEIAQRAMERRQSLLLEDVPALAPAFVSWGRGLRTLHCMPMRRPNGDHVGGIALVREQEGLLEQSEWALLASFGEQGAEAVDRSRRFKQEHDVAVQLQRSLLPDGLPEGVGIRLAGHYRAGGAGLEVGGDWYDAVRRPDGIIHLCVGDVIGRGIAAAMQMGRYRSAFRAYAYECVSPADIVRRILRHVDHGETMITVACVSLDPYSGELAYSSAGHPPPLLIDVTSQIVQRLDGASAPPLGVADAGSIREAHLTVGEQATLVLYSDGLIERRGRNIDGGIELLGRLIATGGNDSIEELLARVTAELGSPSDDVALLVATLTGERIPFEAEIPSSPSVLPDLRRRLRAWLVRRELGRQEMDEVLLAVGEACNNAVEHAYRDDLGSISVCVDEDGETLRATVLDRGRWRDPTVSGDRGRGIEIMRAVMDVADVRRTPTGTEVLLERRLHARHAGVSPVGA